MHPEILERFESAETRLTEAEEKIVQQDTALSAIKKLILTGMRLLAATDTRLKVVSESQKALSESQKELSERQKALSESQQALADGHKALMESHKALIDAQIATEDKLRRLLESQRNGH
jgi:chromosome segregation ATPase